MKVQGLKIQGVKVQRLKIQGLKVQGLKSFLEWIKKIYWNYHKVKKEGRKRTLNKELYDQTTLASLKRTLENLIENLSEKEEKPKSSFLKSYQTVEELFKAHSLSLTKFYKTFKERKKREKTWL